MKRTLSTILALLLIILFISVSVSAQDLTPGNVYLPALSKSEPNPTTGGTPTPTATPPAPVFRVEVTSSRGKFDQGGLFLISFDVKNTGNVLACFAEFLVNVHFDDGTSAAPTVWPYSSRWPDGKLYS